MNRSASWRPRVVLGHDGPRGETGGERAQGRLARLHQQHAPVVLEDAHARGGADARQIGLRRLPVTVAQHPAQEVGAHRGSPCPSSVGLKPSERAEASTSRARAAERAARRGSDSTLGVRASNAAATPVTAGQAIEVPESGA